MTHHHAFLVTAPSIAASPIPEQYKTENIDTHHICTDVFSIDAARALTRQASQKAVREDEHVFVILCQSMTREAQNALLKLFEEPPAHTQFFVVMQNIQSIIPTLLSRFVVLDGGIASTNEAFVAFIALPYSERMNIITEKTKAKERTWIQEIITGALTYAHKTKKYEITKSATLVGEFSERSGASKKMLLEELALVLPVE